MDFAPDTGLNPDGQPFTGASHGVPADVSTAQGISTLGNVFNNAATLFDENNQAGIEKSIRSDLDQANAAFGYDGTNLPDQVGQRTNVPPEIGAAANQMTKLQQARAQGKLTDSHYWALLNSNVKDLRAQYPGYNDQIDALTSKIMGGNPANMLRASIDQYNLRTSMEASDSKKLLDSQLQSQAKWITQFNQDMLINPDKYTDQQKRMAMATAAGMQAQDLQLQQKMDQLKYGDAVDSSQKTQATNVLGQAYSTIVNRSLQAIATGTGTDDGASWYQKLQQLQTKGATPDELIQMGATIDNVINQTKLKFNQTATDPAFKNISPQDRQAAEDAAMKPLLFFKSQIAGGDTTLANMYQRLNTQAQGRAQDGLSRMNPWLLEGDALNKMGGPQVAFKFFAPYLGGTNGSKISSVGNVYAAGQGIGIATGKQTIDGATNEVLNSNEMSPADKSATVTEVIKNTGRLLADPKYPDSSAADLIHINFGAGGLAKTWSQTGDSSKGKLYNQLLSPQVTDRVAKLGEVPKQEYLAWMMNAFQTIPEVRMLAGDVAQGNTSSSVQYSYNPNTHQILVNPGMNGEQTSGLNQAQFDAANVKIAPFNQYLATAANVMNKLGVDPNDPSNPSAIPQLLKNLGADGLVDIVNRSASMTPKGEDKTPATKVMADDDNLELKLNDKYKKDVPKNFTPTSTQDSANIQFLQSKAPSLGPGSVQGMTPTFRTQLASLIGDSQAPAGLGLISGWRSKEHQQALFDQSDGSGKMVARPGHSQHETGNAADLSYNGKSLRSAPAEVVQWVHQNAAKYGLTFPMSYEPWHIEPIGARAARTGGGSSGSGQDDGENSSAPSSPAGASSQPQGNGAGIGQGLRSARQAPDGNWYVPDPARPGKYLHVQPR